MIPKRVVLEPVMGNSLLIGCHQECALAELQAERCSGKYTEQRSGYQGMQ